MSVRGTVDPAPRLAESQIATLAEERTRVRLGASEPLIKAGVRCRRRGRERRVRRGLLRWLP
jgi:hypothetical protein